MYNIHHTCKCTMYKVQRVLYNVQCTTCINAVVLMYIICTSVTNLTLYNISDNNLIININEHILHSVSIKHAYIINT